MTAILNITIEQGATFSRDLVIQDDNGAAVDLTDVDSARAQLRRTYSSSMAFNFEVLVSDPVNGVLSWSMDAITTASIPIRAMTDYLYDIQLVRGDVVERAMAGIATVTPAVTRV